MDLLPKHMCHRCSYKLEEFHKFYIDCLKTDTALKSQLSWMRKDTPKERIGVPMVHIENMKIKSEPEEVDSLLESVGLVDFPVPGVQTALPDCIMYTSFANTSRCQYYCDKTDPTRQPISKNCTHPQLDIRESTDLTYRLNGVSEGPEPEILWKKRKNLFDSTKEPRKSLHQEKPLSFPENTLSKTGTLVRTLRPRKRSVDYVGTKRKPPAPDSENGPKITEPTSTSISNLIIIKDEPLEVETHRILRPRKHPETEVKSNESRSKSAERCRKRVKTSNTKLRRSQSLAQGAVFELEIKKEIVDSIQDSEELRLRLKSEPPDVYSPPVANQSSKKRKDGLKVKEVSKPKVAGPRINKDGLIAKAINNDKQGLNISKVGKPSKIGLIGKEEFKIGKVFIKRSSKVCFSPKNLRSQDLHLRSGKVKANNALDTKSFRRDIRKNLLEKISDNAKMKVVKLANVDVKHLCEKCNISFINKELFRLHACYSN